MSGWKSRDFPLVSIVAGLFQLTACHPAPVPDVNVSQTTSLDSVLAASADTETRELRLGFGIGYLARAPHHAVALRTIAGDGFRYVRAFEPFRRNLGDDYSLLVSDIDLIVSNGLVPYLSLSNFPYDLIPVNPDSSFRDSPYPPDRREGVVHYSNRYPPADMEVYRSRLQQLLGAFADRYGQEALEAWYFEIGNEPDAPRFFWGTADDFRQVFKTALATLHAYNPSLRVGGAAFTSRLFTDPQKSAGYGRLATTIASYPETDFLSFHIYSRTYSGRHAMSVAIQRFDDVAPSKPLVVSEWNVTSAASVRVDSIIDSEAFVPYLVDVIAACWTSGVDMLLIHKLMDFPRLDTHQLGLFDRNGHPKRAYRYVRLMREIVESGFSVIDTNETVIIRGAAMLLAAAGGRPLSIDFSAYEIRDASEGVDPRRGSLPPGEWVFLAARKSRRPADSRGK